VMFYTYIIWSQSLDIFYKGITRNPDHRLWEHNNGMSRFTTGKGPWALMYLKQHTTKREAIIEEKRLKRLNDKSIHKLISSPNNIAPPLG
ncbi:MAG: GIY-YIG nuclease family protein, partial [Bacteroidales bacterium]|nr:GIY-YIG nuclease family protein [Bacteroidales bacterium]